MFELAGYRVGDVLGEGGSGTVYAAVGLAEGGSAGAASDAAVAIKVLRADLELTDSERKRFLAEAALLARIAHPAIVPVLASGTLADGRPYLVMPRLAGEPLSARLARGPLSAPAALTMFEQLADAVTALHAEGVIHRDLKPDNIFIGTDDRVVLLDFGIAKDASAAASTTTTEGRVRGTPAYMAPERFFHAAASTRTDLYELAVTLYVMLVGALPWRDVDDVSARLDPDGGDLPPALWSVLRRALASNAVQRPASVRELRDELLAAAAEPAVDHALRTRTIKRSQLAASPALARELGLAVPPAAIASPATASPATASPAAASPAAASPAAASPAATASPFTALPAAASPAAASPAASSPGVAAAFAGDFAVSVLARSAPAPEGQPELASGTAPDVAPTIASGTAPDALALASGTAPDAAPTIASGAALASGPTPDVAPTLASGTAPDAARVNASGAAHATAGVAASDAAHANASGAAHAIAGTALDAAHAIASGTSPEAASARGTRRWKLVVAALAGLALAGGATAVVLALRGSAAAGASFCAGHVPPPLFCADFSGDGDIRSGFFNAGREPDPGVLGGGSVRPLVDGAERAVQFTVPALAAAANKASASVVVELPAQLRYAVIRFRMRIAHEGFTDDTSLAQIFSLSWGKVGAVNLSRRQSGTQLVMYRGVTPTKVPFASAIPVGTWTTVKIAIKNYAFTPDGLGEVVVMVDGIAARATLPIELRSAAAPRLQLGVLASRGPMAEFAIDFDDVSVTAYDGD